MKFARTVLKVSIHPDTENPVFGENATHVIVEDEAGGPFIILHQCHDNIKPGEVSLAIEELRFILEEAEEMIRNYPAEF